MAGIENRGHPFSSRPRGLRFWTQGSVVLDPGVGGADGRRQLAAQYSSIGSVDCVTPPSAMTSADGDTV